MLPAAFPLLLAAAAAAAAPAAPAAAGPAFAAPAVEDTLLDIAGYRMHLVIHRGTRPLTIVMESGGGASISAWARVDEQLAAGRAPPSWPMTGPGSAGAASAPRR